MGTTGSRLSQEVVPLAKDTWAVFQSHNAQWLAAALAYFAAFAVAPLIIVVVEILGLVVGNHQHVLNMIFDYLQRDAGAGAGAVKQMVSATFNQPRKGVIAEIVGWVIFVVAAIGLFNSVQFALNTIWDVPSRKMGILEAIRERFTAFGAMMGIALLLLLSMLVNALLTAASGYLMGVFPGFPTIVKIIDFVVSFAVIWGAFAVLFEYLPECRIEWRDVGIGAALTSFLFVAGQFLLGWYLGRAGVSSGYGAFGSLVVFLIWVNYSAQIMLLGASFTRVYAKRFGSQQSAAGTATARHAVTGTTPGTVRKTAN